MKAKRAKRDGLAGTISSQGLCEFLGISRQMLTKRRAVGEMVSSRRGSYAVADLVGLLPSLWSRLCELRADVRKLQAAPEIQARQDIENRLRDAKLRSLELSNGRASGSVVDLAAVIDETNRLAIEVRMQANELQEQLIQRLHLLQNPDAIAIVERTTVDFLDRIGRAMQKEDVVNNVRAKH
jgi:hypothetical protein